MNESVRRAPLTAGTEVEPITHSAASTLREVPEARANDHTLRGGTAVLPTVRPTSLRRRGVVLFAEPTITGDPSVLSQQTVSPGWLVDHIGLALGSLVVVLVSIRQAVADSYLPLFLYPGRLVSVAAGGWDPAEDLGHRSSASHAYAPLALSFRVLEALHVGPLARERAWVAAVLFVSASGAYWLSRIFWEHQCRTTGLVAAALYVGSPYVLLNLSGVTVLLLPYAVTPWIALALVHVARHRAISGMVAAALASLPALGVNPPIFAIMISVALGVGVAEGVRHPRAVRRCGLVLIGAGACVLINVWWLLPFVGSLSAGGADAYFVTDPISVGGSQSSYLEVMRLTGLWALYQSYGGESYYAAAGYLRSRLAVIAGSVAPVAFLGHIARRWSRARSKALLLVFLVAVPLSVSVYPPQDPTVTGHAYQWLYDNVFIFRSFRSNYKWVAVISLLFALVIPIAGARQAGDRSGVGRLQRAVLLVLVPLFLVPLFGDRIWTSQQRLGDLPQYWRDAGSWLTEQPQEGRALFLPMQGFSAYTWGRPSGDVSPAVTTRKVLTPHIGAAYPVEVARLLDLVAAAPTDPTVPLARVVALLGVRFIVQRNDVDQQRYGTPSNTVMGALLRSSPGLMLAKTFGRLDIYEVTGAPAYGRIAWSPTLNQVVTDDQSLRTAVNAAPAAALNVFLLPRRLAFAPGVAVSSTSNFGDNEQDYGAGAAFDGDPASAWVPAPQAVRPRLDVTFPHRPLGAIRVIGRRNGVDALPTSLALSVGGEERTLSMVDGVASVDLGGVVTDRLSLGVLTLGPGGPNAGLAEIDLGFDVGTRLRFPAIDLAQPSTVNVDFLQPGRGGLLREIPTRGEGRLRGEVEVKGPLDRRTPIESYLALRGARSVTTSSTFGDDPGFAGLWAIVPDGIHDWVPAKGGVGEWWQVDLGGPRSLTDVAFRGRANGVDGEVAEVELSDGHRSLGRKPLRYDASGSAVITVGAVVSSLRITVTRSTAPGTNVGFRSIGLPGVVAERLRQKVELDLPAGSFSLEAPRSPKLDEVVYGGGGLKLGFDVTAGSGVISFRPQDKGLLHLSKLTMTGTQRPQPLQALPLALSQSTTVAVAGPVPAGYVVLDESADPLWQAPSEFVPLDSRGDGYAKLWQVQSASSSPRIVFRDGSHWRLAAGLTLVQLIAGLLFLCWGRRCRKRSF